MSRFIRNELGAVKLPSQLPAPTLFSSLNEVRAAGIDYPWMRPDPGINCPQATGNPANSTAEQDEAARLRDLWKRHINEADRVASMAANELNNTFKKSPLKRLAMMETDRKFKTPTSQWHKAIESNSLSLSNAAHRRTERMQTDDDQKAEEEEAELRGKKHKYANYLSDAHSAAIRQQEHLERMAEMRIWYSLFDGDAAEMIMFWYGQGWSLSALTYVAKSRLKSNIPLLEGHEMDMVSHFIYARETNPQDLVKVHGIKRVKTQQEEDVTFVGGETADNASSWRRSTRRREAVATQVSRRRATRLPPGAMQRLNKRPYTLYQEAGRNGARRTAIVKGC